MEPITVSRMMDLSIQLNGKYVNVDGAFGNQCWDSAARVAQLLGLPVVHTTGKGRWYGWAGNMWDAFPQTPAIAAAYYRVGPDQAGQPGDTAIWGDSNPYYPATHVATVIRDFGAQLLCLSQNSSAARPDLPGYSPQSTGPTILQHLPKRGLLGYLRPRTGINPQGTTETGDEDMPTAKEIADEIFNRPFARQGPGVSGEVNFGAVVAWYDANNAAVINATVNGILNGDIPWAGFDGNGATPGRSTTTLATAAGYADAIAAGTVGKISALEELVKQLAVKQGVVIDYDKIAEKTAKAVNDEAAKRLVK